MQNNAERPIIISKFRVAYLFQLRVSLCSSRTEFSSELLETPQFFFFFESLADINLFLSPFLSAIPVCFGLDFPTLHSCGCQNYVQWFNHFTRGCIMLKVMFYHIHKAAFPSIILTKQEYALQIAKSWFLSYTFHSMYFFFFS